MHLLADEHFDSGRAEQPVGRSVPSLLREHSVACDRKTSDVGHLRSGDEPDSCRGRQPQRVEHPGCGDLLENSHPRGAGVHTGHLVVGADQPVGRQRHRQRPPDDEAVIARSSRRDEARPEVAGQIIEHDVRRLARVGQRPVECQPELGGVDERPDMAAGQRTQPRAGDPARLVEKVITQGGRTYRSAQLPEPGSRLNVVATVLPGSGVTAAAGGSTFPWHVLGSGASGGPEPLSERAGA